MLVRASGAVNSRSRGEYVEETVEEYFGVGSSGI